MAAAHPRRLISNVLAAGLVLLGASACAGTNPQAAPSPSISPSSIPTTSTTPTTTEPPASPSATGFPSTAKLYAEAVLLAWRTNQQTQLAELVTPTVLSQLQATTNVDHNWLYSSCDGTAGSMYCLFFNGDGDAITLRLENLSLGKAHAATEVKLDRTTYSTNAVEYVKAFIEAWRNANTKRMAVLANQSEVDYFTHYTPPGTYTTCVSSPSPFVAQVRVYNGDGLNYTLSVSVPTLGNKHAITGHSATPAPCT